MKKLVSFVAGAALFMGVGVTQQMNAQVYSDYKVSIATHTYDSLRSATDPKVSVKNAKEFWVMPTKIADRNDGYVEVRFNEKFRFMYNGVSYDRMYVSVNGFVTFNLPPNVIANDPKAMFTIENSYADNVIAPFWGDHMYRTQEDNDLLSAGKNKWAVSKILVLNDTNRVVVEWRDLNIIDYTQETGTASIASFQLYLNLDGSIEFAYGTAGRKEGQDTRDTRLNTTGAAVGLKGESGVIHAKSDYINGLMYKFADTDQKDKLFSTVSYSNDWQPSGGSDKRIVFTLKERAENFSFWGDGDADMSKMKPKHYGMAQNRYVTINDVRTIMRSIVTNVPLDSVKGRAAFHADVNHNGRYIYKDDGTKYTIPYRSAEFNQDLPLDLIGSEKQLMFEVTEYDAALIMQYLGGRTTKLPWLYDTTIQYGKVQGSQIASNVVFGTPESNNNGTYRMPVYINGDFTGAIAAKFEIDGRIISVNTISDEILANNENNVAVLAADSKFNNGEVLCFVDFVPNNDEINIKNIRFNDSEKNNVAFKLSSVDNKSENTNVNYPNPFNLNTKISINIEEAGVYSLNVYDSQGLFVKSLSNGFLNKGINSFEWLGDDQNGDKLGSGMYIYRLTGNGVNISNSMIIVR